MGGFTRKNTLERRKNAGEAYLHPRTRDQRRVSEPHTYSVCEVEHTNSLVKLQRLVEDFRRHKGSERKSEVEDSLIAKIIQKVWGYPPREIQAEVLRWLVFQREDCILTAKTSMGKSLPLQAVSVLVPNSVALIILPLDKVGQEQVGKLENLSRKLNAGLIRPVFVNADTKATNPQLFDDIKMLKYTHVFIGPEQAVGEEFGKVLREPSFKTKVSLVAIDEAHLVSKWGTQFRQSYAQLGLVRSRLGQACPAPWFACSATLDAKGLEALQKGAHFARDVHHIRGSIDRTDISFAFKPIEKRKLQSFEALHFTIDECKNESNRSSLQKIPKTIIFVDSKQMTRQAMTKLKQWIKIHRPECKQQHLDIAIKTYHRNTGAKEKERIYTEFSQPESQIRIVVATESLGLGIDLNDVQRVVLYGLPLLRDLDTIMQRFGRAARASGMNGDALLLYEYWAAPSEAGINIAASQLPVSLISTCSTQQEQENSEAPDALPGTEYVEVAAQTAQTTQQKRKSDNERRAQLPEILKELIDASTRGRCLRDIINRYYEEWRTMESTRTAPPSKERCCSSCNPALIPSSEPSVNSNEDIVKLQIPRRWALPDLEEWCTQQAATLYPNVPFIVPSDLYLDSLKIKKLAKACFDIENVADLQAIVGADWPFLARDGQCLVNKIEAIATVVKERWNQVTKERNTRKKKARLQQASEPPCVSSHQPSGVSADSQVSETLSSSQVHLTASTAPIMTTTFKPDSQIISTSPVKQHSDQSQFSLRKRLRRSSNALESQPAQKKTTSGVRLPLGALDINVVVNKPT